jgi:WD40 repeat protein
VGGNQKLDFKGHESDVWSMVFRPGVGTLISADGDWNKPGQVKIWDPRTAELRGMLPHSGEVLSVACSRDGLLLAAGGADKILKVWRFSPHDAN